MRAYAFQTNDEPEHTKMGNGRQHPGKECSQLVVAEPVISSANSKNRRSHNTAERKNCISKVLHVLEPPKTQPLYNIRQLKVRIA